MDRAVVSPPDAMGISLNKPVIVLAALALLVALLLYGGLRDGAGAGAMAGGLDADATIAVAPFRAAPAGMTGAARPDAVPQPASVGAAPATPERRRAGLSEAFEHADDLYVYLQTLLPAVAGGDADAAWMASRVYDYCAPHAMDPAGYARDTEAFGRKRLAVSTAMVAARERVSRRCRQFAPGDQLGRELVIVQRLEAAEGGSLAAEAALLAMGEPLDEGEQYRRELVERVQRSEDPEAFSALAPAMGMAASGDPAHSGQVAGTAMSELAWQLGACALGLDCGPDGALMTQYCANGGVCSRNGTQDFETFVYDAAIPKQETEAVDEMVDSLLGGGVPK